MSIFNRYRENEKDIIYIPKISKFQGEVELIGSKSIANRVLYLSSFCEEETILYNVPHSDDVQILLETLPDLGISIEKKDEKTYKILGKEKFLIKKNYFNLENAGTALRPLITILSTIPDLKEEIIIDGNEQMRNRPVFDLIDSLKKIGVNISSSEKGTPPVKILSGGWKKNQIFISGKTSSQYISALLMAAPLSNQEIEIFIIDELVSKPYVDITINLMKQFSVEVVNQEYKYFKVPYKNYKSPKEIWIEGDATAATYFFTAGLLSGPVCVKGLSPNSIQGDIQYLEIIKDLGGLVSFDFNSICVKNSKPITGISMDMNAMPDAAMTLAVTGLFCSESIEIYNVENLRIKESERIKGLVNELKKFGCEVIERKDGLKVFPPKKNLNSIPRIETYKDHRMAMSFSLASFLNPIEIMDPDCIKKTYPNYFFDFEKICHINN